MYRKSKYENTKSILYIYKKKKKNKQYKINPPSVPLVG